VDFEEVEGVTCVVTAVGGGAERKGIETAGSCRGAAGADGVGREYVIAFGRRGAGNAGCGTRRG